MYIYIRVTELKNSLITGSETGYLKFNTEKNGFQFKNVNVSFLLPFGLEHMLPSPPA